MNYIALICWFLLRSNSTARSHITNPFDSDIMGSLCATTYSPNLFNNSKVSFFISMVIILNFINFSNFAGYLWIIMFPLFFFSEKCRMWNSRKIISLVNRTNGRFSSGDYWRNAVSVSNTVSSDSLCFPNYFISSVNKKFNDGFLFRDPVEEAQINNAIDKFWASQKYVLPSPHFVCFVYG